MNDRTRDSGSVPERDAGAFRPQEHGSLHVLFVCTGNTCRSPMAEAIGRAKARERGWDGIEVRSAGAGAFPGSPAAGGAVRAAAGAGLDLAAHRATLLTRREVEWADLILTMSPAHLMRVSELGGGDRAALLVSYAEDTAEGAASVPDPIGGTDAEYLETYRRLEDLIERVLDRLAPGVGT